MRSSVVWSLAAITLVCSYLVYSGYQKISGLVAHSIVTLNLLKATSKDWSDDDIRSFFDDNDFQKNHRRYREMLNDYSYLGTFKECDIVSIDKPISMDESSMELVELMNDCVFSNGTAGVRILMKGTASDIKVVDFQITESRDESDHTATE